MRVLTTKAISVEPFGGAGHYISYEDPELAVFGSTVSATTTGVGGCKLKSGDKLEIFKEGDSTLGLLGVACTTLCEQFKKGRYEGGCKAYHRA